MTIHDPKRDYFKNTRAEGRYNFTQLHVISKNTSPKRTYPTRHIL